MNPKTFLLIAGTLAAEQRPAVAHSASYGSGHPPISQAPAGAIENCLFTTPIVFRAFRCLNNLRHDSHSASYGKSCRQMSQAPAGATENHHLTTHFVRPVRGLNRLVAPRSHSSRCGLLSHATPWLTQNPLRDFDLWRTRSPIY